MYLLDADTLTDLYYNRPAVRDRRNEVPLTVPVLPTVISRAELLRGRLDSLLKAATARELLTAQLRLQQAERFLAQFDRVAPFDVASAALFFEFIGVSRLRKAGRKDMMNAAIAVTLGATLVTRNVRDYRDVPRLKLEVW